MLGPGNYCTGAREADLQAAKDSSSSDHRPVRTAQRRLSVGIATAQRLGCALESTGVITRRPLHRVLPPMADASEVAASVDVTADKTPHATSSPVNDAWSTAPTPPVVSRLQSLPDLVHARVSAYLKHLDHRYLWLASRWFRKEYGSHVERLVLRNQGSVLGPLWASGLTSLMSRLPKLESVTVLDREDVPRLAEALQAGHGQKLTVVQIAFTPYDGDTETRAWSTYDVGVVDVESMRAFFSAMEAGKLPLLRVLNVGKSDRSGVSFYGSDDEADGEVPATPTVFSLLISALASGCCPQLEELHSKLDVARDEFEQLAAALCVREAKGCRPLKTLLFESMGWQAFGPGLQKLLLSPACNSIEFLMLRQAGSAALPHLRHWLQTVAWPRLEYLDVSGLESDTGDTSATTLLQVLASRPGLPKLRVLNMGDCLDEASRASVHALTTALREGRAWRELERLALTGYSFTACDTEEFAALFEAMATSPHGCSNLKQLEFVCQFWEPELPQQRPAPCAALARAFMLCPTAMSSFKTLIIYGNQAPRELDQLAVALESHAAKSLEVLRLSWGVGPDEDTSHASFFRALGGGACPRLRELSLWSGMTDDAVSRLAGAMKDGTLGTNLRELSIYFHDSSTSTTFGGAELLAEALGASACPVLDSLDISGMTGAEPGLPTGGVRIAAGFLEGRSKSGPGRLDLSLHLKGLCDLKEMARALAAHSHVSRRLKTLNLTMRYGRRMDDAQREREKNAGGGSEEAAGDNTKEEEEEEEEEEEQQQQQQQQQQQVDDQDDAEDSDPDEELAVQACACFAAACELLEAARQWAPELEKLTLKVKGPGVCSLARHVLDMLRGGAWPSLVQLKVNHPSRLNQSKVAKVQRELMQESRRVLATRRQERFRR